jgi:formylglycine-generating enzyme required for sulfatase activity
MIKVEGGTFAMGATKEQGSNHSNQQPTHKVTLSTYYIGETEVTQELWEAVMGTNPSKFKGAKLPVENVSWTECQQFISKINQLTGRKFRLPTEAEWEFAARGGKSSKGYKFAGSNNADAVAWHQGNSGNKTHNVGTKAANELGLYDMCGNVWEWTQTADGEFRVFRGGCWDCSAWDCESSYRRGDSPSGRNNNLSFRLCASGRAD